MGARVVLFELNEVPLRVIDDFVRARPASALARALPLMRQYETLAEEPRTLSPWITWPSVHRGVSSAVHGIFHLGQATDEADAAAPPVWKLLAERGVAVGVFGSLHSHPMPADLSGYAFFVPDTFAADSDVFPEDLEPFQRFNLRMARESAKNVSARVPWGDALSLLARLPGMGLKPATALSLAGQLASERARPWTRVRRRTSQTEIAFDLFMRQLERTRPGFATFFTNHVASSMHRYWAAAYPGDYEESGYDEEWRARYRGEIAHCMARFDRMLFRLLDHVSRDKDCTLVVASSMGQAATVAQPVTTQVEVRDAARLMSALGLPDGAWRREPAMLPQLNVFVEAPHRERVRAALRSLRVDSRPLAWDERSSGFFSLDFGHANLVERPGLVTLGGAPVQRLDDVGLTNLVLDDATGTSAYHVPQGSLLVLDPKAIARSPRRAQVSALDVAPWILSRFGIAPTHLGRAAAL